MSADWITNVAYGRSAGTVTPTTAGGGGTFTSCLRTAGNTYRFQNTPNNGTGGRNGYWMGRYLLSTNRFFATAYQPFGVEVIRSYCYMDYETNVSTTADLRRHCSTSLFLLEDNTPAVPKIQTRDDGETNFWYSFRNSLEFCNEVGVWGTGDRRRVVGYYETALVELDFSACVRPDGTTTNVSNRVNFNFQIDTANGVPQNEDVGFRMIHNGSKIQFFVNPDPYGTNGGGYPNEWLFAGERQVVWSSNIQLMVGHAQQANNANSGSGNSFRQDVEWDDVLVRSAADSSTGYLDWKSGAAPHFSSVRIEITNRLSSRNAGINVVRLEKPEGMEWKDFRVALRDDDGSRFDLKCAPYQKGLFPKSDEAAIVNHFGAGEVRIVLGNQITSLSQRKNIEIAFTSSAREIPSEGASLKVSVMADQFDAMPRNAKGRYSTCGFQQTSGDFRLRSARSLAWREGAGGSGLP